jgi:hypothetical protein
MSRSYTHKASVIALGDSAAAQRPYLVLYSVRRLSGGDPDAPRPANDYVTVLVQRGLGEIRESGGFRWSTETWEPEKIELTPIGFVALSSLSGAPIQSQ